MPFIMLVTVPESMPFSVAISFVGYRRAWSEVGAVACGATGAALAAGAADLGAAFAAAGGFPCCCMRRCILAISSAPTGTM